jgi:chemotaxis signal transduction protein
MECWVSYCQQFDRWGCWVDVRKPNLLLPTPYSLLPTLMAIYSPLRYRRFSASQAEKKYQLIGFRLQQEWFALPIDAIQKVVPLGRVYGDPKGTGISLTNYEGREVLTIDVGHQIFQDAPSLSLGKDETSDRQRFLAILKGKNDELVGLPIDSPPSVLQVTESAFTALPEAYMQRGNIKCISSMMVQMSDRALFLLDRDALLQLSLS